MKAYELLYFVAPNLDEESRANIVERVNNVIANQGDTVDSVEDWGKRKLAYEINKLTEGDYILVNFHADPAHIAELDRVLRINDTVQRHMIVRRSDRD